MSCWRCVLSSTNVPLQVPTACWGWHRCKTPLRVPQARQGVSVHVCVPLLRLDTDGLGWPMGRLQQLQGNFWQCHTTLCFTRFAYTPVSQVKKFQRVFYISLQDDPFYDWKVSKQMPGCWLIWLVLVFLAAVPACLSAWVVWLSEVWVWVFFYHSLATINDFICLDLLRDWMDWLQVVIKILERDLKLGL